jgi:multimeric flavodoxin WrbA
MKVLGFVASPRKDGNTDTLVDTFLDGASSAGAEVKKHFLADLEINQCRGCFRNCILEKGMRCKTFRDDMDMLLPDMASSDLMLFASPFYLASYTAIMSRFFERCLSVWETKFVGELGTVEAIKVLNNPLKGKKAVMALVQDYKNPNPAEPELAFKAFQHNLSTVYMMEVVEKIHVTDVRDIGDINKKTEVLEKIRALGKNLATP